MKSLVFLIYRTHTDVVALGNDAAPLLLFCAFVRQIFAIFTTKTFAIATIAIYTERNGFSR